MSTQLPPTLPRQGFSRLTLFVCLGLILPVAAIVMELICHLSAMFYFDPVPSPLHILLLATVPLANLWLLYVLGFGKLAQVNKLLWLNSVAMGIALIYTMVYARLFLLSLLGLVFMGIGLLPLAPLLALGTLIWGRRLLARTVARQQGGRLPGWWRGMLLALAVLVMAETWIASDLSPACPDEAPYPRKADTMRQRWLYPLTERKMSWELVQVILRRADAALKE